MIFWLILCRMEAWAGPPFLTDDPQPVDFQHWEFYLASMDFRTAGGWTGDGPHVEINYGVVPNVQLHVIAPVAYDAPRDGPSHYGYGDTELGVKFRFVQETKDIPMVGIFPLLEEPRGGQRIGADTHARRAWRERSKTVSRPKPPTIVAQVDGSGTAETAIPTGLFKPWGT